MARFELTTPASRRQCSTRLSYTPTKGTDSLWMGGGPCKGRGPYSGRSGLAQWRIRGVSGLRQARFPQGGTGVIFSGSAHCKAAMKALFPALPAGRLCAGRIWRDFLICPMGLRIWVRFWKTRLDGASPSGKASVFGIDIPRFESWRPSHLCSQMRRQRPDFRDHFIAT